MFQSFFILFEIKPLWGSANRPTSFIIVLEYKPHWKISSPKFLQQYRRWSFTHKLQVLYPAAKIFLFLTETPLKSKQVGETVIVTYFPTFAVENQQKKKTIGFCIFAFAREVLLVFSKPQKLSGCLATEHQRFTKN